MIAEQYGFLAGLWYKGGSQDFWHRSRDLFASRAIEKQSGRSSALVGSFNLYRSIPQRSLCWLLQ